MKLAIRFALVSMVLLGLAGLSFAQRNITAQIQRDVQMEADAEHNLEVARRAFRVKKAYKEALGRFDETFAVYPDFSKMDEFYFIAGMSSYLLSQNKGKQKVNLKSEKEKDRYDPAKLKDDAIGYLSAIVEKYPQSKFRGEAETALTEIKAAP